MSEMNSSMGIKNGIWRPAIVLFLFLSLVTGVIYPFITTFSVQLLFPKQAEGGLIIEEGHIRGSELIGQSFEKTSYFWGRLSATAPMAYNASASGGSNLGSLNPTLRDAVKARIEALKDADPSKALTPIPVDLVTSSASGLDPHISVQAANYQISRVAKARKMSEDDVKMLVDQFTEMPWLGFLGEARVNVLELNLALDHQ
jgi:potassium-transporting ATPase KdpC subunit